MATTSTCDWHSAIKMACASSSPASVSIIILIFEICETKSKTRITLSISIILTLVVFLSLLLRRPVYSINLFHQYITHDYFSSTNVYPANTTHLPNVWPMLGQRRRRWANIGQTLGRCVVFAGQALQQESPRLRSLTCLSWHTHNKKICSHVTEISIAIQSTPQQTSSSAMPRHAPDHICWCLILIDPVSKRGS